MLSHSLLDLHNDVAHPVKSLVDSEKNVQGMLKQLKRVTGLAIQANHAIDALRQDGEGAGRYRP